MVAVELYNDYMVDYSYNKNPKDLLFYFMSYHIPVARISNIESLSYPFILDHVVEYITTGSMQNPQLCANGESAVCPKTHGFVQEKGNWSSC